MGKDRWHLTSKEIAYDGIYYHTYEEFSREVPQSFDLVQVRNLRPDTSIPSEVENPRSRLYSSYLTISWRVFIIMANILSGPLLSFRTWYFNSLQQKIEWQDLGHSSEGQLSLYLSR